MPTNDETIAAEAAFIERMSAGPDDADEQPAASATAADSDASDDAADASSTTADDEAPDADDPADAPESDEAEQAEDAAEGEDAESDDDEPEADAPPATDASATAPEREAAETDDARAFRAALAREGAVPTLDDVPAEARPLVEKKLRDLEAGFTKARQREAAEVATLRAEARFQTERPVDYIVALIRGNAELTDKVNAKLDELEGSPTAAEAHDIVVRDARQTALAAEQRAVPDAVAAENAERALDAHLTTRLQAAGITPGKAFERMLADAATIAVAKGATLTTADIDALVDDYAADLQRVRRETARAKRRADRTAQVKAKVEDKKKAGPAVKPGTGTTPGVARQARPQNETPEQFTERFAASLR